MAAINELKGLAAIGGREWIAKLFWAWFEENGEREVTVRVWFVRKKIKIKHLHGVFELLFGPQFMTTVTGPPTTPYL